MAKRFLLIDDVISEMENETEIVPGRSYHNILVNRCSSKKETAKESKSKVQQQLTSSNLSNK